MAEKHGVIAKKMLRWFSKNQRFLPWRTVNDPYRVWVSEVMSQQTQIDRVVPKYEEFIARWPTVDDLAKARQREVVAVWSGLGYNRRAVLMHRAAKMVVSEFDGRFPQTVEELKRLSGIGEYIARAIASFAYHQPVMLVDTNHRRVMQRIFYGQPKDVDAQSIAKIDKKVVKTLNSISKELSEVRDGHWRFNQGVMDFGAIQCSSKKPLCETCPLLDMCKAGPQFINGLREKRNIVTSSQGKFEGSRRWYRGKIILLLKDGKRKRVSALAKVLDLSEQDLRAIMHTLEQDGMITVGKTYCKIQ